MQYIKANLEFFETYGDKKLQDLSYSERMFLKEPIFSGDFFCEVIAEKDFFQDLGKANVLNLFKIFDRVSIADVKQRGIQTDCKKCRRTLSVT